MPACTAARSLEIHGLPGRAGGLLDRIMAATDNDMSSVPYGGARGRNLRRVKLARSSLDIQRDVLFAIFLRELKSRFSGYVLGNVWLILEPLMMMVLFITLFGLRGRGEFGFVEPPVFILAAFLPFKMLWGSTMKQNMTSRGAALSVLNFRQARLFDIFLARTLVEGGVAVIVGIVLMIGLAWLGVNPLPRDPLSMLGYAAILWVFAASAGILFCVVSSFSREIEKLINLINLPLLFLSAVFFPMTAVPEPARTWMAYNPLVHPLELIREAWFPLYQSPVASLSYFAWWTVGAMTLALASYRLQWRRMLAS
ncbi:capsular polysaccharide transport system permease protein [Eilatimonas milleporae]|uniref:Transport permease protein n=2 Tax=Eilatimonas milleporae TaxID=911205 RepID=A0A3M0D860_9PROT|nr:capsular polysaccharide transport system permease protein [Eilatimonas milleporae]